MRLLILGIFAFFASYVFAQKNIEFESVSQVVDSYSDYTDPSEQAEYLGQAYNYLIQIYQGGEEKVAYSAMNTLIDQISEDGLLYWKLVFIKGRNTMAVPAGEPEQIAKDRTYMKQVIERGAADSILVLAYATIGFGHYRLREYREAIPFLQEAADRYALIGKHRLSIDNRCLTAVSHYRLNKNDEAIDLYLEAEAQVLAAFSADDEKSISDKQKSLTRIYNGLANVIKKTGDYQRSNLYLEKTLDFTHLPPNHVATIKSNICGNYLYMEEFAEAERYAKEVLAMDNIQQKRKEIALNDIIRVYANWPKVDSAAHYLDQLQELSGFPEANRYSYYLARRGDVEYAQGKYEQSRSTYLSLYRYHLEKEPFKLNSIRVDLEGIIKSDLQLADMDSSIQYFSLLIDQIDTINTVNNENEVLAASVRYETELKERENKELRQANTIKNLWLFGGGVLASLLLVSLLLVGRNWQLSKKNAELLALQNESLEKEKAALTKLNTMLHQKIAHFQLSGAGNQTLVVDNGTRKYLVTVEDLLFVKWDGNMTQYHMTDGTQRRSMLSFVKATENLPKAVFAQVNRNTTVNISKMTELASKSVELENGSKHKLGRRFKDAVGAAIEKLGT